MGGYCSESAERVNNPLLADMFNISSFFFTVYKGLLLISKYILEDCVLPSNHSSFYSCVAKTNQSIAQVHISNPTAGDALVGFFFHKGTMLQQKQALYCYSAQILTSRNVCLCDSSGETQFCLRITIDYSVQLIAV